MLYQGIECAVDNRVPSNEAYYGATADDALSNASTRMISLPASNYGAEIDPQCELFIRDFGPGRLFMNHLEYQHLLGIEERRHPKPKELPLWQTENWKQKILEPGHVLVVHITGQTDDFIGGIWADKSRLDAWLAENEDDDMYIIEYELNRAYD